MNTDAGGTSPDANSTFPGIPVKNLWLLMAYAAELGSDVNSGMFDEEAPGADIPKLVAELLIAEVERRIRGHLSVAHSAASGELSRVKGRISHLETSRRKSMSRGVIFCHYATLTHNTRENQFAASAMQELLPLLKGAVKERLNSAIAQMMRLGVRPLTARSASALIRELAPNPRDTRMIDLAKLALQLKIPTQTYGAFRLYHPGQDAAWLRSLYERAVKGFYAHHLERLGWTVRGGTQIYWQQVTPTSGMANLMPIMRTDIELVDPSRAHKIIIDTKFTQPTTSNRYGKPTFKSGHIYQLYAYIRSQENLDSRLDAPVTGMLLYPSYGETIREDAVIQGHRFCFRTVDLMQSPTDIRNELLALVGSLSVGAEVVESHG